MKASSAYKDNIKTKKKENKATIKKKEKKVRKN